MRRSSVVHKDQFEAWKERTEKAEALADDLENQIAELTLGMDDAEAALERALADGAAMRRALDFIKDLEVEVMFRGHGEDYAKMAFPMRHWQNLCKVHAADHPGDKLLAAFQARVGDWMRECFGPEISADTVERNHRFLEEALEMVQANKCTASEAHQLVDYVYGRPTGDPHQECGGVMVTLAALCLAADLDMDRAGEDELSRVWTKIEVIRKKQAGKPKYSPLPGNALDRLDGKEPTP